MDNKNFSNQNQKEIQLQNQFQNNNNNKNNNLSEIEKEFEKQKSKNQEEEFDSLSNLQVSNILIKLSIALIAFGIWMIYRFTLQQNDKKWTFNHSFEDKFLSSFLLGATNYISQNLYIRDYLLIMGSAFLDIFLVCFMITYIFKGNSWNPLVHISLFYFLRGAVMQSLIILEIYDTYIFENPGFPSMIVPYFRSADFFFSGHAGCSILIGLQMSDMGYTELKYFGFFLAIFEGFVLMVLRAHYSIDIVFGILISHYLYIISKYIGKYLDMLYPMGLYNKELIDENGNQIRCCN